MNIIKQNGMQRRTLLGLIVLFCSSFLSEAYAIEFPRFRCFTDRENEFLVGNVKKVVYDNGDGVKCEYNFNQKGNYTSVSIEGYCGTEYPFCKKFYRYYCEGLVVNNYLKNFLSLGIYHNDFHVPFWLDGMGGAMNLSFSYDNSGKLVYVEMKNRDYTTGEYKFVYDANGNLTTRYFEGLPMIRIKWNSSNISSFYMYDSKGHLQEGYDLNINGNRIEYSPKGTFHTKVFIETNSEGKIVTFEKIQGSGWEAIKSRFSCTYNGKGLLEKLTRVYTYQHKNPITTTTIIKYDSYNNILEYKTTENSVTKEYIRYSYIYDRVGNWISKTIYSIKQGDIEVKHKDGVETREITYYDMGDNNKLTNRNTENISSGQTLNTNINSNRIYDVVEEMPVFPGGSSALIRYIASNVRYPAYAEENEITGNVYVSFVIERDGSVTDVRVTKGVDPSLDKEAVRVVRNMPKWIPGKQNGSPVRVEYSILFPFRMQ